MPATVTEAMKDRPEERPQAAHGTHDIPTPHTDGLDVDPPQGGTADPAEPARSKDDLEHAKREGQGI